MVDAFSAAGSSSGGAGVDSVGSPAVSGIGVDDVASRASAPFISGAGAAAEASLSAIQLYIEREARLFVVGVAQKGREQQQQLPSQKSLGCEDIC